MVRAAVRPRSLRSEPLLREALELRPDSADSRQNLDLALELKAGVDAAIVEAERAAAEGEAAAAASVGTGPGRGRAGLAPGRERNCGVSRPGAHYTGGVGSDNTKCRGCGTLGYYSVKRGSTGVDATLRGPKPGLRITETSRKARASYAPDPPHHDG